MLHLGHSQASRERPPRRSLRLPNHETNRIAAGLVAAALGLLGLCPAPGQAAEALYLKWNDCPLGATAASNLNFACNSDAGQDELVCAFTMPQAANNVIAVEIVLDIQHATSPLPDWWRLQSGGCRSASDLSASADFSGKTACLDMWGSATRTAMVQGYIPTEPRGADSQARIKVTANVLPADAVSVDGANMYYAARIILKHANTVGGAACAGCDQAACLVLNSILIGRVPDPSIVLQMPGPGDGNWARWQGGAGADCAAVPVRNRAWGQLKSQYR